MAIDELLVARTTTTIVHKGRSYPIRRGETVVHADDEVVQGRERLFRPLTVTRLGARRSTGARRATETATAGPGELRAPVLPPETGEPEPADPYEGWTRKELTELCRARGLSTSGAKGELAERLRASEPDGG